MEDKLLKLEKDFQDLVNDLGVEIQFVEFEKEGGYSYLRVYIEKEGITTLDDCEKVSQLIGDIAENSFSEQFYLEVSTPGLERKLTKQKHFVRFAGEKIQLKTKSNVDGQKSFEGILKGMEDDNILIDDKKIPFSKLKVAKTVYDMSKLKSKEEN